MLHGLETAYRPAKLGPLLGVLDGHIQHRFSAAQHLHAVPGDSALQSPLNDGPALAHISQHRACRDFRIVQLNLTLPVRGDGA